MSAAAVSPALPHPLVNAAVATDGQGVYVFGGYFRGPQGREASAEILRFDPHLGAVESVATLPSGRLGASVAWTGTVFLLVGGLNQDGTLDEVVSFDPRTREVERVARLPEPLSNAGVAWAGSRLLVAGGFEPCETACPRLSDELYEVEGADARVATRFPHGLAPAAFFDGANAYFVGGLAEGGREGRFSDRIFAYAPTSRTLTELPDSLPEGRIGMAVVWHGGRAFLVGGEASPGRPSDRVLAYAPREGKLWEAAAPLKQPRSAAGAAVVGGQAYVVGGIGCPDAAPCNTILPLDLRAPLLQDLPDVAAAAAEGPRETPSVAVPLVLVAALAACLGRASARPGRCPRRADDD